jgi:prophage regulatory protein
MARSRAAQAPTHVQRPQIPSTAADRPAHVPPTTATPANTPAPLLNGQERLLRLREVITLISVSRATIYRYLSAGTFPAPIRVGPRRVAWRASDINTWFAGLQIA